MAIYEVHKDVKFGVGDEVKVHLKINEGEKTRNQVFHGMVIGIKGRDDGKSFTVRRIGEAKVGIEMIFPLSLPSLEKIEVLKSGTEGIKHAKLYYVRTKPSREIEKIYSRAKNKNQKPVVKKTTKTATKKFTTAKTSK